jgi:lysophospholipase L1-like esterase
MKPFFQLTLLAVMLNLPITKTIWLCGDSTMAIKDSKVFPETGWGMPFVHFWQPSVSIKNLAKNGRSTKTFRSEMLWKQVTDSAKKGDYVFIQFGHNDEAKEKVERYAPPDSFLTNLRQFVEEAKAVGAIPVLITPVSRRKFDQQGNALPTHAVYSPLVKQVAAETGSLVFDLDEQSRALYQQFGPENSKWLFLQLQKGEHPNYPDGKIDNTHFSELGARLIAQIVLKDIQHNIPELANLIIIPAVKK